MLVLGEGLATVRPPPLYATAITAAAATAITAAAATAITAAAATAITAAAATAITAAAATAGRPRLGGLRYGAPRA